MHKLQNMNGKCGYLPRILIFRYHSILGSKRRYIELRWPAIACIASFICSPLLDQNANSIFDGKL